MQLSNTPSRKEHIYRHYVIAAVLHGLAPFALDWLIGLDWPLMAVYWLLGVLYLLIRYYYDLRQGFWPPLWQPDEPPVAIEKTTSPTSPTKSKRRRKRPRRRRR